MEGTERSQNSAYRVDYSPRPSDKGRALCFADTAHGRTKTGFFDGGVAVAGVSDDGGVCFVQQGRAGDDARILMWRPLGGGVTLLVTIPMSGDTLVDLYVCQAALSADGRYLTLTMPAQIGDNVDLWAFDLKRRVGRIVKPDHPYGDPVSTAYRGDRALVSLGDSAIEIDLRSMESRALALPPIPGGGR